MAGEPIIVQVTPPPTIVVPVDVPANPAGTPNIIAVGGINQHLVAYSQTQNVSSSSWVIPHNLGYNPNVTIVDSAGTIVEGEITYTNPRTLTVHFTEAFTGKAYLS